MDDDTRQDISLAFFGEQSDPVRLVLRFGNDWANFPSVTNSGRWRAASGKIIWNHDLKKKLEGYKKLAYACCKVHLGFVPCFSEPMVAIIGLSGCNKRKDIDNCFKGVIDYALEKAGIVSNDRLILVLPVPLWWGFKDEGYTFIDLQRWRDVKNDYSQFLAGQHIPVPLRL